MISALGRMGNQFVRVALLLGIIVASGVGLGLATGYPVSRIEFDDSQAVRLDQGRLAGEIDPADALVTQADLPVTWTAGDPAISAFGLLGLGFCGEEVTLPTALSGREASVFTNTGEGTFLISEAIRVDRWQSARSYVDDVADSVGSCTEFFRPGSEGERTKVEIRDGMGDPPITDHVSRTFVSEDGSYQVWSLFAVGDVLIALQHTGPERPPEGFLSDLEEKILMRVDPADFAPGGAPTTSQLDDPEPTLPDGGVEEPVDEPVDESEAVPGLGDPAGSEGD